ncbi:MAG: glycosyltransferase family 39 protein [Anaerolineae bacterium]|nr:glycosyltransferase family 39 protein [Anaerolineae bacterium]
MQATSDAGPFFPKSGAIRWLILIVLFVTALGIRMVDSAMTPYFRFDTREYYSAVIAKGNYYELIDAPEPARSAVILNRDRQPVNEPPVMEFLVAHLWALLGDNNLAVATLLSSIFWLIGGWFVYQIAMLIGSSDGAIFALAIYLFVPVGIIQSNNFQPDPLMIMMVLASIFTFLRYAQSPTTSRLVQAGILTGLTILLKLQASFLLAPVFLMLSVYRHGWRKTFLGWHSYLFAVLALAPVGLYLFYGFFITERFQENAGGRLLPNLLLTTTFWRGWLRLINYEVGFILLVGGLLGVLASKDRLRRYLLIGMWLGYIFLGLVFTYNMHTHRYYHLPLIPIVALSVAEGLAAYALYIKSNAANRLARMAIYGLVALSISLSIILVIGSHDNEPETLDYEAEVQAAIEIGQMLDHDQNTIILGHAYALPMLYHSELSGATWLPSVEVAAWHLSGRSIPDDTPEHLAQRIFEESGIDDPSYFIVTDMHEWEHQVGLREYLTTHHPIVAETDLYIIFDLRSQLSRTQG